MQLMCRRCLAAGPAPARQGGATLSTGPP